jgi:hypothetical protein
LATFRLNLITFRSLAWQYDISLKRDTVLVDGFMKITRAILVAAIIVASASLIMAPTLAMVPSGGFGHGIDRASTHAGSAGHSADNAGHGIGDAHHGDDHGHHDHAGYGVGGYVVYTGGYDINGNYVGATGPYDINGNYVGYAN